MRHNIKFNGRNRLLVTRKEQGVSPASWQHILFTCQSFYDEVIYNGVESSLYKYPKKIRLELELIFKASKNSRDFSINCGKYLTVSDLDSYRVYDGKKLGVENSIVAWAHPEQKFITLVTNKNK